MEENQTEEHPICEDDEREKANTALQELIEVFQKHRLRIQDMVVVYGNLGYAIGAAMEGHEPGLTGPTLDELNQRYYTEPTIGVALMLQGLITTSWHDQVVNGLAPNLDKENKDG